SCFVRNSSPTSRLKAPARRRKPNTASMADLFLNYISPVKPALGSRVNHQFRGVVCFVPRMLQARNIACWCAQYFEIVTAGSASGRIAVSPPPDLTRSAGVVDEMVDRLRPPVAQCGIGRLQSAQAELGLEF